MPTKRLVGSLSFVLLALLLASCPMPLGRPKSTVNSLTLNQGKVYLSGSFTLAYDSALGATIEKPAIWENGTRVLLPYLDHFGGPSDSPWAQDLFFENDDQYVWGSTYIMLNGSIGPLQSYYWKNGEYHEFVNQTGSLLAMAVYKGQLLTIDDNHFGSWLDDNFTPLSGDGSLKGLLVDGQDLYFCGTSGPNRQQACVWKNGTIQTLEAGVGPFYQSEATSLIQVGDVFAVGWLGTGFPRGEALESAARNTPQRALEGYDVCLWKAGEKIVLGSIEARGPPQPLASRKGTSIEVLAYDDQLEVHRLFELDTITGTVNETRLFPKGWVKAMQSDETSIYYLVEDYDPNLRSLTVYRDSTLLYQLE